MVLWASAARGHDDTLEVPLVREAEQREPAHEVSRLRTWNVREGRLDATHTPLATPTPVAVDTSISVSAVQTPASSTVEALIRSYDWEDDTALRIAGCESGVKPEAISYDGTSYGVMQLYAPIWAGVFPDFWSRWDSAEWNIARAWDIYVRAGYSWHPWACW